MLVGFVSKRDTESEESKSTFTRLVLNLCGLLVIKAFWSHNILHDSFNCASATKSEVPQAPFD